MKPLRWIAFLPLAILPFLAAVVLEGPRLEADLQSEVAAALAAAGQGWARPFIAGRDIQLRGRAPNRGAVDAARATAEDVFGVRRVELRVGAAQ